MVLGLGLMSVAHGPAKAGPSLVFDVRTGEVLHAKNPGAVWYPASLTKLMTAYLTFKAMKAGKVTPGQVLTASKLASAQHPSKIGIRPGGKISVETALEALIVRSANDIAVVLAEGVGGSLENFVRRMNETAQSLGMTGTYFANPHGLPDVRHKTTARDMGLLARSLLREFPEHRALFSKTYVRIGKRRLRNRNSILKRMKGADGMKTGFVCASGYNLVASATRAGRKLVAVVLGARSSGARSVAAQALLEKAFNGGTHNEDDYSSPGYSLGKLVKIANAKSRGLPESMHKVVCRRSSPVRLTRPSRVEGWAVVFDEFDKPSQAHNTVQQNLLALRDVIYAGDGLVVKNYAAGRYRAMMASLTASQASTLCTMRRAKGRHCEIIGPDTLVDPPALIAADRKRRKRRARKRSRRKKTSIRRRGRKTNIRRQGTVRNFSEGRFRKRPRR